MQKKILCICTLLISSLSAMEKDFKIPLELTHQSPEITRVHSPEYLQWLEKQAKYKNFIECTPKYASSWKQLKSELRSVRTTLKATRDMVKAKEYGITLPTFAVSFGDSNSFAGNRRLLINNFHKGRYATIPIAAAYALQTNLFKRILIIDENLNVFNNADIDKLEEYYRYGNGALFYSPHNEQTSSLFKDKVVNYDKVNYTMLWNFLNNEGKDIDLVFYNIDLDNNDDTDQRNPNIFSLFQKCIPVVFIISDHKWHTEELDYTLRHITRIASKLKPFFIPGLQQELHTLVGGVYKLYNDNGASEEMYHSDTENDEPELYRLSEPYCSESDDNDYDDALSNFHPSESDEEEDDDNSLDKIIAKYKKIADEKGIVCKNKFYM